MGFPGGSEGKESACNAGDVGSILGLGRSPGGGHGNPLQYSCLENPHGQRRLAGYSPWGHKESDTTEQLSTAQHSKYMYVSIPTYPTLRLPQLVSTYLLSMFVSLFLGNIFDCHNLRGGDAPGIYRIQARGAAKFYGAQRLRNRTIQPPTVSWETLQ